METQNGAEMCTCPFCEQIHMAEVDNPGDPKACDAAASMVCDCVGATNWRNQKRAIEDTQRQIEKTFGPQGGKGWWARRPLLCCNSWCRGSAQGISRRPR